MEFGTYILSIDKSQNVWGQTWFENYPFKYSKLGIERISVMDDNRHCHCEQSDLEINSNTDLKEEFFNSLSFLKEESHENITLTKMNLDCGERYRHIYRPQYISAFSDIKVFNPLRDMPSEYYSDPPIDNIKDYNSYIRQLEWILDELFDIFKVVSPHRKNMKTFGNTIRNILMLSCTEVDAILKSVLCGNGALLDHPTMNNYKCLILPLRLSEYTMSFRNVEDIEAITPFEGWEPNPSSESPIWYNAYNNVKHDRINNFRQANLKNAIYATLALAAVIIASYGYRNDIWNQKIGKIIFVEKEPIWKMEDFYFPAICNREINYINYPDIQSHKTVDKNKK